MVHPVPRKLSSHPCAAHAIFFNVLKFRVESHHFQVKKTNSFMPQSLFRIWPAATNVVALRPHQTKRKPTAVPSWITQPPRNIFAIYKTRAAKRSPWGLIQLLTSFVDPLRPYSKMLTLPMVHPVPRKLSSHPCETSRYFLQRPQVQS